MNSARTRQRGEDHAVPINPLESEHRLFGHAGPIRDFFFEPGRELFHLVIDREEPRHFRAPGLWLGSSFLCLHVARLPAQCFLYRHRFGATGRDQKLGLDQGLDEIESGVGSGFAVEPTTATRVRGSVHFLRILGLLSRVACSMAIKTRLAPATRSMAPPMPFSILPGIAQLARVPFSSTCRAPRTVRSTWPPRIMANESADEK